MNVATSTKSAGIHAVPGKALGIWAFVLSFLVPVLGLVFGFVALRQSRRAGVPNDLAIAAIAISTVLVIAAVITVAAIF